MINKDLIKELAVEYDVVLTAENFADLIVKKCADIAFQHAPSDESACELSAKIEEYFGLR